jgi:hypothetical protein
MKTYTMEQFAHQGDVQIYKIAELPKNPKKIENQFIAASERSGSFHALFGEYDMFEVEGGFAVECHDECILNHSLEEELRGTGVDLSEKVILPKKDHRHTTLPKGKYLFGIQNRFNAVVYSPMTQLMGGIDLSGTRMSVCD